MTEEKNSEDFATLFDQYLTLDVPKGGEFRDATVISRKENLILVDIGAKSEGVIPANEVELLTEQQVEELSENNTVRVFVTGKEDQYGNYVVSYLKVAAEKDWNTATENQQDGTTVDCRINGVNRGGVIVRLGALEGFIPFSQLGEANRIPRDATQEQRKSLIGRQVTARITEANSGKGKLVLSERVVESELRSEQRAVRFEQITPGEIVDGRVTNLTKFGAFVDIGGVEGLVHISELGWQSVKHPSDVVKVGDAVKVEIQQVDVANERISLSMKKLQKSPWERLGELYSEGQLVEVKITQLAEFGAFARIRDDFGLEGLIHISELSADHIQSPDEVVKRGDKLTVRIIRLDSEKRQIALSLKQVFSEKYFEQDFGDAGEGFSDASDDFADSNEEVADSNEEVVDSNEEVVDSNEEVADSNEEVADSNEEVADSNEE